MVIRANLSKEQLRNIVHILRSGETICTQTLTQYECHHSKYLPLTTSNCHFDLQLEMSCKILLPMKYSLLWISWKVCYKLPWRKPVAALHNPWFEVECAMDIIMACIPHFFHHFLCVAFMYCMCSNMYNIHIFLMWSAYAVVLIRTSWKKSYFISMGPSSLNGE